MLSPYPAYVCVCFFLCLHVTRVRLYASKPKTKLSEKNERKHSLQRAKINLLHMIVDAAIFRLVSFFL